MPSQLAEIERIAPRVAAALARAEDNRMTRTASDVETLVPFLQGMDEVFEYLYHAEELFLHTSTLEDVAVLLRRARGDFEIDIEAIFSGLALVASNAMRDVMEIHYLLRDFLDDPARVGSWKTASNKDRVREFGPGRLRARHAAKLGVAPTALPDTMDYRIHSVFLHPMPWESNRAPFGISKGKEHLEPFILSWDATYHAHELVNVVHAMLEKYAPEKCQLHPQSSFGRLKEALEVSHIARWATELIEEEDFEEHDHGEGEPIEQRGNAK